MTPELEARPSPSAETRSLMVTLIVTADAREWVL